MSAGQTIGRFKGQKWLESASYLTEQDREQVYRAIRDCREIHPSERRTVGVRCSAYIGEPSAFATVIYGAGQRIYCMVYKAQS